jgi:hypothetical protein
MTKSPSTVRVFIGSSSEGRDVARNLQAELAGICEVERWDQSVFEPGGYSLDSLLAVAGRVDFAVMVASPDDTVVSRGVQSPTARDNIILEFGLFAGVLGRQRVYLLQTDGLKLPTDVLGVTRLPYRPQSNGNQRAAVNDAALQIQERIRTLGALSRGGATGDFDTYASGLEQEISLLCANAVAQGWTVKANSPTTLRLRSPKGKSFALSKAQPAATRLQLRRFAAELAAGGLRVNQSVRRPIAESPF